MDSLFFCPPKWQGRPRDFNRYDVYPWVKHLPIQKNIFCDFWTGWRLERMLPTDYDIYIISYHIENINLQWLEQQQRRCKGKFIVLHPGYSYNYHIDNTTFITYTNLHRDLDLMIKWWGNQTVCQNKTHKFSAICNRVSQSKIWITTKLLETAPEDSLILLNSSFLEMKNVHNWEPTGHTYLDSLTDLYRKKYSSLILSDGFDQTKNQQRYNSNPYQPIYTDVAVHFVNGSFHYSQMQDYIYPGPDIDEKTLKCLLAGVAFVPCAQFETLKFLQDLGLEFNYDFDLTWDSDAGNITRFDRICQLIDTLSQFSIEELVAKTKDSTEYNRNFILDRKFFNRCESINQQSINQLMSLL